MELTDRALVHVLLAHETERAVERVFGPASHAAACKTRTAPAAAPDASNPYRTPPGYDPNQAPPTGPGAPVPPWVPQGPGFDPPGARPPHRRNLLAGCAVWALMACTCQLMCCDHNDPFSREHRQGWCVRNDCDCNCGDCSGCGDCCQCCGDGGCCDGCGCDGCDCGCDC